MSKKNDAVESYLRFRPIQFKDVHGQEAAISMAKSWLDSDSVPHGILFNGPSGTGKTTLARILREQMGISEANWTEYNAADLTGVDHIRKLKDQMSYAPKLGEPGKIYFIDECQKLSDSAQNMLLKITEDYPSHCYFWFGTTHPAKIIGALRTRLTDLTFKSVADKDMESVVARVAKKRKVELSEEVMDQIVALAEGSPRRAINLFDTVRNTKKAKKQLAILGDVGGTKAEAIKLARMLLDGRTKWPAVCKLLKELEAEDPERLRRMILGYARSVLLGQKSATKVAKTAASMIDCFREPYFNDGKPGLAVDCFNFFVGD